MDEDLYQISEDTIICALESLMAEKAEDLTFEIDFTQPITVEVGDSETQRQDSKVILGKEMLICLMNEIF